MKSTKEVSKLTINQIELEDSFQKFEDLLATNNLFVDYFNEFLCNSNFGDKVKFNIVTGELELIENDANESSDINESSEENIKKFVIDKTEKHLSAGEIVKKKLETQLKSIIKKAPSKLDNASSKTINKNFQRIITPIEPWEFESNINGKYDNDIMNQVNNHSFKDIDLIKIEARLEPTELKDQKAAKESKIPVLKTRYSVNVLKKPYSLKWLKYRRLSLFLQSKYYSEFKLAMILAQFGMFNHEVKYSINESENKIKNVKIEIDQELLEMEFNPFKTKTDLEKLYENSTFDDFMEEMNRKEKLKQDKITNALIDERIEKKSESEDDVIYSHFEIDDSRLEKEIYKNDYHLIDNENELFKSIKNEKLNTSLVINLDKNRRGLRLKSEDEITDDIKSKKKSEDIKVINSVTEMANILVKSVINQALSDSNDQSTQVEGDPKYIEKKYRYIFTPKSLKDNNLEDFNKRKSNSRLSYYRDFLTENDTLECNLDKKNYLIEFEDEPYELTDSRNFMEVYLRKPEIEKFKCYLKENDAYIYFKLWIDIEKLSTLVDEKEKTNLVKYLKTTYNRPQILNRLNTDYDRTNNGTKKNKYYELYSQYEKNIDFWSYDYLVNTFQKKILNSLIFYWWPKYCIRMNSFKDYIKKRYPYYYVQKSLCEKKLAFNDLDAENIEKSLNFSKNFQNNLSKNQENVNSKLKKKKSSRIKILDNNSASSSKFSNRIHEQTYSVISDANSKSKYDYTTQLIGYDLDDYKTSPPVGWKRPPSNATLVAKAMLETRNLVDEKKTQRKKSKIDKDIFLEAIYREEFAGQVFMKYLMSKNKIFAVNRLKCLQELIKYKDMFYDENFNQETVKKIALEIYSKYIAVSANNSIDCSKSDRLKIHHLFNEANFTNTIGGIKTSLHFKPTYEDTFDLIEEFLLISLYDDWKDFMDAEEKYFNHNEIENIERSLNIKSKKIDELLEKGLIKIVPKSLNQASFSRKNSFNELSSFSSSSFLKDGTTLQFFDINDLINDTKDFEMFKKFLDSNNALTDIQCWMDLEAYTRIDPNEDEKIEDHARLLKKLYLNKKYFFSKKSPIDSETQNIILEKIGGWSVLLEEIPPNLLIVLAKKNIEKKIKNYWLPMYYNSEFRLKSLFNNRTQMMDVVDDILYLKDKATNFKEHNKIKNRRWLYSSQMIINFGKALRNSFTTKVFCKFLKYKSAPNDVNEFDLEMNNNLVNNLQFLVEVQDYKELCQKSPEDERSIIQKMKHIIDTFINNRIPPKIRIDIPENLAERILEQKDYLSPYLFLNTNLFIFDTLMPYWIEFNQIRSESDLELFDEYSTFKKMKDYRPSSSKRAASSASQDESVSIEDHSAKWKYNQYIKVLKSQLVL